MDPFDIHLVEYRLEVVSGDTTYVRHGSGTVPMCRELAVGLFDEVATNLNMPGGFERPDTSTKKRRAR